VVFPDRQLETEGERFLHRLRASGYTFLNPDGSTPAAVIAKEPKSDLSVQPSNAQVELVLMTAPPTVRSGTGFGVQVRVFNRGTGPLTSTGDTPFYLSYWAKAPGAAQAVEGRRTALLIDLPSGGALTQAVFVDAPQHVGIWSYDITPLTEHVCWQHSSAIRIDVQVIPETAPDPLATGWATATTLRDYQEDHLHAFTMMNEWLQGHLVDRPTPRVLELGGNAAPMLAADGLHLTEARLYNLDIDPHGLAFGTIQRRIGGGRAVFDVVGDGTRLPFADTSLDAIVMFATLHHFPDPIRLLRHLRTKLTPGGLICVMCEPMGHVSRENLPSDYREELLEGICEQAFQPWEYLQFFEAAGLRVAHAMVDTGSLKVALKA
jgi:SAM-dependent methyltransferase